MDAFHDGQIGFLDIVDTVARVVEEHQGRDSAGLSVEEVLRADAWARTRARKVLGLPDMDAATGVAGTAGHGIASGGAS